MKLSIITINYNHLNGLKITIDSVLSQTWHDYEWIVIDGGSSDGSKELIEQNQHLFSYWCSEPDNGIYDAMNKGIAHVNGEYINFMNSGDAFASNDTLNLVFAHNHRGGVLYGDWISVYDTLENYMSFPEDKLHTEFLRRNICQQAMFYKSDLLKQKGFDLSIKVWADYARNVELALSGISFKHLPFVVCKYNMNGISNNDNTIQQRRQDRERIKQLYPQGVLPLLSELDVYRNRKCVQYTLKIIDGRSRFLSFITKAYLSIMHRFSN